MAVRSPESSDVATLCVKLYAVTMCRNALEGSEVKVCSVIGFPHGNHTTQIKVTETELAIRDGAVEIDMVINIGKALGGDWDYVRADIEAVNQGCTSVARALIEGLRHDITADDGELGRLVPQRLLTFRGSVQAVFEAERNHAVEAHWTEGAFPMRDYRLEHAFYAMRASGSATTSASPAEVWPVVTAIGGENRYYALDWLWTVRGWLDWLVGGTGQAVANAAIPWNCGWATASTHGAWSAWNPSAA